MMDTRERRNAQRLESLFVNDHHAARAVANLARRRGGYSTPLDD